MNINGFSVLLGGAGLLIGGIGLVAQDIHHSNRQSAYAEAVESPRAANWPPHPLAAGVEFHDETLQLMSLGPQLRPRSGQRRAQEASPDSEASIKLIRTLRVPGSRRTQFVEIEFVDSSGRTYLRRYPVERETFAGGDRREELEPDRPAAETYGYSQRRSRRSGRRRGWW
jgi:hypothetical protein